MARYDVVIIGGAIVGSSVAYYLREEGFSGSIALIDRDPQFSHSATTLSCASIRQQFSIAQNIRLSQFTLALFRRLKTEFGEDADIGFRENGYLILATEEGLPVLAANHAIQQAEGADIVLEDAAALQKRFPWMSLEGHRRRRVGPDRRGLVRRARLSAAVPQGAQRKEHRFHHRFGHRHRAEWQSSDGGAPRQWRQARSRHNRQRGRPERRQGCGSCRHRAAGRAAQAQRLRLRSARKISRHAAGRRSERHLCAPGRLGLHHRRR